MRTFASRSSWLILVAVLLAAFNMRVGIAQVGPVIEELRADTGMSSAMAGFLNAIPFLCFGIFAFIGGTLVARFGTTRTVAVSIACVAVGTAARAVMPSAPLLLVATIPIGFGVALLSVCLAVVVKDRFAERAGTITGAYVAAISGGAAIASFGTPPLADALGGWRAAFAVGALPALIALPLWTARHLGHGRPDPARASTGPRPPSRRPDRTAVVLAVVFGLQSLCFSAMISWIAAVYEEAGWSQSRAALATASIPVMTVVASLLVPILTTPGTRRGWVFASGVAMAVGLVAIATTPTSPAVLWLFIFGLGCGAIFPLVMTLPLDLHERAADVAALTGWMLGIGYLISGTGPTLVGALRDVTDGFTVPVLVVAGCALTAGLLALSPWLTASRGYARASRS